MRSVHCFVGLAAVALVLAAGPPAVAQQVTVGTPYHTLSDSFFENFGVSWGLNWGNGFFRFGGSPFSAAPQFGGFDPSAGVNTGWAFRRNGLDGFFNLSAAQGYRQTFTSQTPSVTLTNGYPGSISDTSVSPFVIGYVPIVGGMPTLPPPYSTMTYPGVTYPGYGMAPMRGPIAPVNRPVAAFRQKMANHGPAAARGPNSQQPVPRQAARPAARADLDLVGAASGAATRAGDSAGRKLAAAQSSSAGKAVPSVAEARRLHRLEQAADENEALALFEKGRTAEEDGKPGAAKIFYRMAVKRAPGTLRDRIQARLDALTSPGGK